MKTIHNQSIRPLRVLLDEGRVLHLAPGGTGQITDRALARPSVQRLLEEKQIVVLDEQARLDGGRNRKRTGPQAPDQGQSHQKKFFPSGDRSTGSKSEP